MFLNAEKILETVLGNRDHTSCGFRVSKSVLENFKSTCRKDGAKNYSPILEEIIKSFLFYLDTGKPIKINITQSQDRIPASFSCSLEVWRTFTDFLPEFGLNRICVLEALMIEYCNQRSKK